MIWIVWICRERWFGGTTIRLLLVWWYRNWLLVCKFTNASVADWLSVRKQSSFTNHASHLEECEPQNIHLRECELKQHERWSWDEKSGEYNPLVSSLFDSSKDIHVLVKDRWVWDERLSYMPNEKVHYTRKSQYRVEKEKMGFVLLYWEERTAIL